MTSDVWPHSPFWIKSINHVHFAHFFLHHAYAFATPPPQALPDRAWWRCRAAPAATAAVADECGRGGEVKAGAAHNPACSVVYSGSLAPGHTRAADAIPKSQKADLFPHLSRVASEASAVNYKCHAHKPQRAGRGAVVRSGWWGTPPKPTCASSTHTETTIHLSWQTDGAGGSPSRWQKGNKVLRPGGEVKAGAPLTLPCSVVGIPAPLVTWTTLGRDAIPK
ncbi:hypothetical protein GWK47_015387 [Chionoecetes opilio]|uniref:Ig-like domain-containing protein n=1 Tax=Chionoecetes opilio TaxID=41210 RepID=A0A8J4Y311_CHIOP|nr:hypothetical protein GWK47_015387 [Chionoecetes opilio]